MFTFSQFVKVWSEARGTVPQSVHRNVGREARDRVQERFAAGRADSPLDFSDLVERLI